MTYKILSMVGGGIRGLLTARLLQRLYALGHDLLGSADLLAGTSTGSDIISFSLSGMQAPQIYETYAYEARLFFLNPGTDPSKPAYDVSKLAAQQDKRHGANATLNWFRPVLMTSFDVKRWQPVIFTNLPGSPTAEALLTDAVVGSSAMPGMFGSWKGLIDGAFVNHDPSLEAIGAVRQYRNPPVAVDDISIICIGTGLMKNWIEEDTSNWGAAQFQLNQGVPDKGINYLPQLFINGQPSPTGNASLNGTSTNMIPDLTRRILGPNRYAYLNATFDRYIPENTTDPKTLEYMVKCADNVDLTHALQIIQTCGWGPKTDVVSARG